MINVSKFLGFFFVQYFGQLHQDVLNELFSFWKDYLRLKSQNIQATSWQKENISAIEQ